MLLALCTLIAVLLDSEDIISLGSATIAVEQDCRHRVQQVLAQRQRH